VVAPRLLGRLDDEVWGHAPWTDDFVDIEGDVKPLPRHRTRAKMLWDDVHLYIGADMEEPHVWGTLTDHDSVIYFDNDFEVFLDPAGRGHHYGEIEVNALNTIWDLMLTHPYRAGGWRITDWEMKGVRTAVAIDGTLNDPSDVDRGWQVEIAIPWTALAEAGGTGMPPADGDQWRINFSRVEWQVDIIDGAYVKVPDTPEDNWVWSPQGAIDMHRPERWGVLQFSTTTSDLPPVRPLDDWTDRLTLVSVWEAQQAYRQQHGRYASSPTELGVEHPGIVIEATTNQFDATLGYCRVDQELRWNRQRWSVTNEVV
jgi:Carbohydrate family 9 binding domain-like